MLSVKELATKIRKVFSHLPPFDSSPPKELNDESITSSQNLKKNECEEKIEGERTMFENCGDWIWRTGVFAGILFILNLEIYQFFYCFLFYQNIYLIFFLFSLLSGEFGDAFIQNTNLEGGDVPATLHLFLSLIQPLLNNTHNLQQLYLPLFTPIDMEKLKEIYSDLQDCVQSGQQIAKFRWRPQLFVSFLENWLSQIRDLAVGRRLIVNGGWLVAFNNQPRWCLI
jgi:hypothetical protein